MAIIAIVACLLLLFAALGASLWWRGPAGTIWYGHAMFYWGMFFLAVYIAWETISKLAHA